MADNTLRCERCQQPMPPGTRGKPKRFCKKECRLAYHTEARRRGDQQLRSLPAQAI